LALRLGCGPVFEHDAGTMLCRRCSGLETEPRSLEARALTTRSVLPVVLCVRCGLPFGPEDLTAQHIAVLAELNRFGLTGRDGLLKPPPRESR
jgi:hypothetical protein